MYFRQGAYMTVICVDVGGFMLSALMSFQGETAETGRDAGGHD